MQPPIKLINSKLCLVSSLSHRIFKRLAKALIRLRVRAGWSEPLLVAHTTLLEISCHGSFCVLYSSSILSHYSHTHATFQSEALSSFKVERVQILIRWLGVKPADLDLQSFEKRINLGSAGQSSVTDFPQECVTGKKCLVFNKNICCGCLK